MKEGNGKNADIIVINREDVEVDNSLTVKDLLQNLWSKAVGTPGYDKREWSDLQFRLEALVTAVDLDHSHGHGWCPQDIYLCLLCRALRLAYGEER